MSGDKADDDEPDRQTELPQTQDDPHATIVRDALIERVKGMLMVTYGMDADTASEVLRWLSRQEDKELDIIAEQISQDLVKSFPPPLMNAKGGELASDHGARPTASNVLRAANQLITEIAAAQQSTALQE
jgi:ANTAR domain